MFGEKNIEGEIPEDLLEYVSVIEQIYQGSKHKSGEGRVNDTS
jgi:hypothetical protein